MKRYSTQLAALIFTGINFIAFTSSAQRQIREEQTQIVVLGIAQDAGYPQLNCEKECCQRVFKNPALAEKVVSLAIHNEKTQQYFLLEASPDISAQHQYMHEEYAATLAGVFVSHAHIGHYTGLMYFGKEAANTSLLPLYVMPRMQNFLLQNAPWEALIKNENVELHTLTDHAKLPLGDSVFIEVFKVPHRDEYSETIGYRIVGPNKSALFIPDIDKWERWEIDIISLIKEVDYAFLDATFFDGKELPGRDMSSIPHPFVAESMARFAHLPQGEKRKIFFIHLNHTNPLIDPQSQASKQVEGAGFSIAREKMIFPL
tara:strand:- start:123551 stop:124498 length:948 start_codon:yes stop_codon:yes gene_type:complete